MTDTTGRIDAYLAEHLDHYIQETARLCAQPSVSARSEGTRECAVLVADLLRARGFAVHVIETPLNPVVVGRLPGQSARTLMFYNHYDVQPPEPLDLWTSPPFEPTLRDGNLYARGAKDDKGEFIARLAAVDAVRAAHGGELPCGVLFIVEGQEEIGSPHMAEFVKAHLELLQCDGSIWEEGHITRTGRPANILGVRGCVGLELRVELLPHDLHSGGAHVIPNAAWRLVHALASLKDHEERVLIAGFYDDVQPPRAIDVAMLEAYVRDEDPEITAVMERSMLLDGADFLLGPTRLDRLKGVFNPTCNIEGLTAGYQGEGTKTIVPAKASAKIDFRLVPDQDPHDILAKLRAHLDAHGFSDVIIDTGQEGLMWPYRAAVDDPLVQLTSDAAREVYGAPSVVFPMLGGSSPMYDFAGPLGGIPIVTAGIGYWGNGQHAPNEHLRIEDFHRSTRHIARILDGFANLTRRGAHAAVE